MRHMAREYVAEHRAWDLCASSARAAEAQQGAGGVGAQDVSEPPEVANGLVLHHDLDVVVEKTARDRGQAARDGGGSAQVLQR